MRDPETLMTSNGCVTAVATAPAAAAEKPCMIAEFTPEFAKAKRSVWGVKVQSNGSEWRTNLIPV